MRATLLVTLLLGACSPSGAAEPRAAAGGTSALSGLAASPAAGGLVHAVPDGRVRPSRIVVLDVASDPASEPRATAELVLRDADGVLARALDALEPELSGAGLDPAQLVNADGTVNLDPEGIAAQADGSFWIASEGRGELAGGVSGRKKRRFESPNLLVRVASEGTITAVVTLPVELTREQGRAGFEGVAATPDALYVAFQRAWPNAGDPPDRARIGRYDLATGGWTFAHYPLDPPTSPQGGWVGLSDLTWLGGDRFAALERDDQAGRAARIKRVTTFSVAGVAFLDRTQVERFPLLAKVVAVDLVESGAFGAADQVPEKLEGLAVLADGTALVVNDDDNDADNDDVNDAEGGENGGATRFVRVRGAFEHGSR